MSVVDRLLELSIVPGASDASHSAANEHRGIYGSGRRRGWSSMQKWLDRQPDIQPCNL